MGTDDDHDQLRNIYGPDQPTQPVEQVPPEPLPEPEAEPAPPPAEPAPAAHPPRSSRAPVALAAALLLLLPALLIAYAATNDGDDDGTEAVAPASTTTEPAPATTTTQGLTLEETPATTAVTSPPSTTVRSVSTACPTTAPPSAVESFTWQQDPPGSDLYRVDVRGTVTNSSGATIRVSTVEVAVMRGGAQVGSLTVRADTAVAPGQVLEWWRDGATIEVAGGAPDAAQVAAVPYSCA